MKTILNVLLRHAWMLFFALIMLVLIIVVERHSDQPKIYDLSYVRKIYLDSIVTDQRVFDSLDLHFSFSSESKEDWERWHDKRLELVSLRQYKFVFYQNQSVEYAVTGYAMIGNRFDWFLYCKEKFHSSEFVFVGKVVDHKEFCSQEVYVVLG